MTRTALLIALALIQAEALAADSAAARRCTWHQSEGSQTLEINLLSDADPTPITGRIHASAVIPQACTNPDCLPEERPQLVTGALDGTRIWDRQQNAGFHYGTLLVDARPAQLSINGATGEARIDLSAASGTPTTLAFARFDGCADIKVKSSAGREGIAPTVHTQ